MPSDRLDVYLGELRALLEADARALGKKPGELLRESYVEWRLGQSLLKDRVRGVVLALGAAVEPDERYDPAEDPREAEAVAELAKLLGSAYAAEGVAEALTILWTRWCLKQED